MWGEREDRAIGQPRNARRVERETRRQTERAAYYSFTTLRRLTGSANMSETSAHMAGAADVTGPRLDRIRVAVVEDDGEICQGLAKLIDSSPGFMCVATCPTAEEALVGLPERQPDVVLMDI